MADPMHVAFVTSEMVPFMKTGGLADVSAALPKALARLGHRVTVLLPRYGPIAYPGGRVPGLGARARGQREPQRRLLSPRAGARPRGRVRRAPAVLRASVPLRCRQRRLRRQPAALRVPLASGDRVLPQPRRAARRVPRPRLADGPGARVPEGLLLGRSRRSTVRPRCSRSTTSPTRGTSAPTRPTSWACRGTWAAARSSSTAASAT